MADEKHMPKWYDKNDDSSKKEDDTPWYNRPLSTTGTKNYYKALTQKMKQRSLARQKSLLAQYYEGVKKRKTSKTNMNIAGLGGLNPKWGQQFKKKKTA